MKFGATVLLALALVVVYCQDSHASCRTVTLSSRNYQYATQTFSDVITSVSVANRISRSTCIEDTSYGTNGNVLWVHYGCRASFRLCFGRTVTCESRGYARQTCPVGTRVNGLSVQKLLSNTVCLQGSNFFASGSNIVVDHGCRAKFNVYT